ncbi:MAG: hypothetical protein M0T78_02715 [Actinomycetota bacterium]|jgi:putative copper export protein|nr:hypothetical protein [Actinomycetota bacterium]
MLATALDGFRLTIHVLAATIWVGGQFTLAGLVPTLRKSGEGVAAAAAKAFSKLSWPAYALLIITGLWNVAAMNMNKTSSAWKVVLGIKITVVALSGIAAFVHARAKSKSQIATWGGISGIMAVASLTIGVFLAG